MIEPLLTRRSFQGITGVDESLSHERIIGSKLQIFTAARISILSLLSTCSKSLTLAILSPVILRLLSNVIR